MVTAAEAAPDLPISVSFSLVSKYEAQLVHLLGTQSPLLRSCCKSTPETSWITDALLCWSEQKHLCQLADGSSASHLFLEINP